MTKVAIRLEHSGNAAATTLSTSISNVSTTINIASVTGWPTGAVGPFWTTIDAGTASEEKVLVLSRSGTALTVSARGADGTTATSHASGAAIIHTFSATEADEANVVAAAITTAGGSVVTTTNAVTLTNKTLTGPVIDQFGTASGLGAAWTAYTPTWTGSGSNPVIGNGTLAGRYKQIGKNVDFQIWVSMGSTTTFGTGNYSLTLPVAANVSLFVVGTLGTVSALDSSAGSRIGGDIIRTSSTAFSIASTTASTGVWGQLAPFTWAQSDDVTITGSYEAA